MKKSNYALFFGVIAIFLLAIIGGFYYLTQGTAFAGSDFIPIYPERQFIDLRCSSENGTTCFAKNAFYNYANPNWINNYGTDFSDGNPSVVWEKGSGITTFRGANIETNQSVLRITNAEFKITHDFRGQRARFQFKNGADSLGLFVGNDLEGYYTIGSTTTFRDNLQGIGGGTPTNYLLEIEPSELNSSIFTLFVNGDQIAFDANRLNFQIRDDRPLYIMVRDMSRLGNRDLWINEVSYLPMYSCSLVGNEKLGIESFQGGVTIDKFSGRFEMKRFCMQHPVIRTNNLAQGSDQIVEPLILLNQGKKVTIPQEETWTIPYVFDGANVQTKCDFEKEAIGSNGSCQSINGVALIAGKGAAINEATGIITITPPLSENCPTGYNLRKTQNGSLICEIYLPVDQLCSPLTLTKTESGSYCEAKSFLKCPDGFDAVTISTNPLQFSCEKVTSSVSEIVDSLVPKAVRSLLPEWTQPSIPEAITSNVSSEAKPSVSEAVRSLLPEWAQPSIPEAITSNVSSEAKTSVPQVTLPLAEVATPIADVVGKTTSVITGSQDKSVNIIIGGIVLIVLIVALIAGVATYYSVRKKKGKR